MRFLIDECTGPTVAAFLVQTGHEIFSVYSEARGMDDDSLIRKAVEEDWILVTNDKDFGEKIYREGRPHRGVVLLRLQNERSSNKIAVLGALLKNHAPQLKNAFVVVSEDQIRFAGKI